ncbi:hypothetical protein TNCV_569341 [Trichonephila clavipes]|nr:hypothetical protein TNCV_569341 [Trichonephila clavipes]
MEGVNINVALFSYTRAFRDVSRHFEPWSSDEDDTRAGTPSPNYHTNGTFELSTDLTFISPLHEVYYIGSPDLKYPRVIAYNGTVHMCIRNPLRNFLGLVRSTARARIIRRSQLRLLASTSLVKILKPQQKVQCVLCYTRAFGDGPRNFEPWSSDEDDIELPPSTNYHATPTRGRLSSRWGRGS